MRKFVSLVLVLLCLLVCFAESQPTDIKSVSNEDLIQLYSSIKDELKTRGISEPGSNEIPLYSGIYTCGKDFEPGSYNLVIDGDYERMEIIIGDSYEKLKEGDYALDMVFSHNERGAHFSVDADQVFAIELRGSANMTLLKVA